MELHPHEIKVLKTLKKDSTPGELAEASGLEQDAVLRAVSWLKTKKLVEVVEDVSQDVRLGREGVEYAEKGLPERQLMGLIGGGAGMQDLKKKSGKDVFNIGLGWLRKKGQVKVEDGRVKVVNSDETEDEKLLRLLKKGAVNTGKLDEKQLNALEQLKSRKNVVETSEVKVITVKPTREGLSMEAGLEEDNRVSQLTTDMLVSGSWRNNELRPYDVSVYVKPARPAKKHPLQRQIAEVRRIFTGMGFMEIQGPYVESAFWNFDALFQPQDHPARDMHDTFYLKKPEEVGIFRFKELKKIVGKTHEDGGDTGSLGWQYKWSEDIARKTLLRTHTTAVTARYLASITKEDLPVKVFSVGKVFRNEAVDYKHLPEFYQVEGIVADPGVNFQHLLGILKQFYDEMGFKKIRFRPAYFPYTEMSVEPEVYFEDKGEWIELGGAGIFRPEVVKPLLGIDCPVLAWGLGLDRVVTLRLGLKDIRELYISDLDWLKRN
ncbi:MAG: phenylalanine--tRNA ligase subunit alpha [Candidatus Altiarchaeota archaeon]